MFGSTEFHVIRLIDQIIPNKFLFYHFLRRDIRRDAQMHMSGSAGQLRVPSKYMEQILIPLPPVAEQLRIISKLEELFTKLDAGIDSINKIKLLHKSYKQSLLDAASIGKLTQRWRRENDTRKTTQEVLEAWKKSRKEKHERDVTLYLKSKPVVQKLPKIEITPENDSLPDSWFAATLESACTFIIDCPHSTPEFTDDGEYCIDTTCIEPSHIIWSRARKVSKVDYLKRISRMIPIEDDILFSREGTIGTVVRVPKEVKICLGQRIMMFRFSPFVIPAYAEIFMQSRKFIEQYKPLILGTSSPHLNVKDIKKLIIFIPPLKEQHKIVEIVESILSILENNETITGHALEQTERLRQSILKKAFEGSLVTQDSSDESASVLLKRIKEEKEKIKTTQPFGKPFKHILDVKQKKLFDK
jgi:type I restriction enzyme, S subunit